MGRKLLFLLLLCVLSAVCFSRPQHVDVNEVTKEAKEEGVVPAQGLPEGGQDNNVDVSFPQPPAVKEDKQEEQQHDDGEHAAPPSEPEPAPQSQSEEPDSPPPPAEEAGQPPPEQPPQEQPAAQEAPKDSEPHNPWTSPSPSDPTLDLEAGHSYNFTWTPNTEGLVSLELWRIEDGKPVPVYLLASNLENEGHWNWNIHSSFPHGAGYILVIVPDIDRRFASLSPIFTVLGDVDLDSLMPPPPPETGWDPKKGVNWSEIEVNREGNGWKMGYAVLAGFIACNLFIFLARWAKGMGHSMLGRMGRARYDMVEDKEGRRVFHARTVSARAMA